MSEFQQPRRLPISVSGLRRSALEQCRFGCLLCLHGNPFPQRRGPGLAVLLTPHSTRTGPPHIERPLAASGIHLAPWRELRAYPKPRCCYRRELRVPPVALLDRLLVKRDGLSGRKALPRGALTRRHARLSRTLGPRQIPAEQIAGSFGGRLCLILSSYGTREYYDPKGTSAILAAAEIARAAYLPIPS